MDILLTLFATGLMLLGIAPFLIAGGRLIASFMARKYVMPHLLWTILAAGVLVGAAFIAVGLTQAGQRLPAALVVGGLPWAAHWLALRFLAPKLA